MKTWLLIAGPFHDMYEAREVGGEGITGLHVTNETARSTVGHFVDMDHLRRFFEDHMGSSVFEVVEVLP